MKLKEVGAGSLAPQHRAQKVPAWAPSQPPHCSAGPPARLPQSPACLLRSGHGCPLIPVLGPVTDVTSPPHPHFAISLVAVKGVGGGVFCVRGPAPRGPCVPALNVSAEDRPEPPRPSVFACGPVWKAPAGGCEWGRGCPGTHREATVSKAQSLFLLNN